MRVGQALEIAVFKALKNSPDFAFFGGFFNLDSHADDIYLAVWLARLFEAAGSGRHPTNSGYARQTTFACGFGTWDGRLAAGNEGKALLRNCETTAAAVGLRFCGRTHARLNR
jgi:hypothetical protein